MAKKNYKDNAEVTANWIAGINKMEEERRKKDQSLHPSKGQMRYVVDFAKSLVYYAHRVELLSDLAHQGKLPFEEAQQYIDYQIKNMEQDIKYLLAYIQKDEEEENKDGNN